MKSFNLLTTFIKLEVWGLVDDLEGGVQRNPRFMDSPRSRANSRCDQHWNFAFPICFYKRKFPLQHAIRVLMTSSLCLGSRFLVGGPDIMVSLSSIVLLIFAHFRPGYKNSSIIVKNREFKKIIRSNCPLGHTLRLLKGCRGGRTGS